MPISDYQTSFTTGGLLYREAIKVAALYCEIKNWTVVRSKVFNGNLLQSRTMASAGRVLREAIPRLQTLTEAQLKLLVNGNQQEQKQILWFAVCKQYPFIHEFAVEMIREKVLRFDPILTYADFDAFFNAKAEWHEELANLTESTRKKLRQVLFRMLREADILSNQNHVLPVQLSPRVIQLIAVQDASFLTVFPVLDTDLAQQVRS